MLWILKLNVEIGNESVNIEALCVRVICSLEQINFGNFENLYWIQNTELYLPDVELNIEEKNISILIGLYFSFIKVNVIRPANGNLDALESKLGSILTVTYKTNERIWNSHIYRIDFFFTRS